MLVHLRGNDNEGGIPGCPGPAEACNHQGLEVRLKSRSKPLSVSLDQPYLHLVSILKHGLKDKLKLRSSP